MDALNMISQDKKKMKIVGENIENKNEQIQRIICIM